MAVDVWNADVVSGTGFAKSDLTAKPMHAYEYNQFDEATKVDGGTAFMASFLRQHLEFNLYKAWDERVQRGAVDPEQPQFRAYQYLKENKQEYGDIYHDLVSRGLLDDVDSLPAFDRQIAAYRREKTLHEQEMNGPWAATLAGGIAATIASPSTYLGAGWVARASSLGQIATRSVIQTGATTGLQEYGLYKTQMGTRTAKEALLNTVSGMVFAGGLVGAGKLYDMRKAYNLRNGKLWEDNRPFVAAIKNEDGSTTYHVPTKNGDVVPVVYPPGKAPVDNLDYEVLDELVGDLRAYVHEYKGPDGETYYMHVKHDTPYNKQYFNEEGYPIDWKPGQKIPTYEEAGIWVHEGKRNTPINIFDETGVEVTPTLDRPELAYEVPHPGTNVETHGSVGAAKAPDTMWQAERDAPVFGIKVPKFLRPRTAATNWTSDVASAILPRIVDISGKLTKGNLEGRAIPMSAEASRDYYMSYFGRSTLEEGENAFRSVRAAMDEAGIAKVNQNEFTDTTRNIINGTFDQADKDALKAAYGDEGASMIIEGANQWIGIIKSNREFLVNKAVELGALDPAKINKNYAYAQMHNSEAIIGNRLEHLDMLIDHLIANPRDIEGFDDWLKETFGFTGDQFDQMAHGGKFTHKDPNNTLAQPRDVDGLEMRKEIMRAFAGDESEIRYQQAEAKLSAAKERLDSANVDLREARSRITGNTNEIKKLTIREAKGYRDKYYSYIENLKAKAESAKAEVDAFHKAAQAARQKTLDRQSAHVPVLQDAGIKELEDYFKALDAKKAADASLANIGGKGGRKYTPEGLNNAMNRQGRANAKVEKTGAAAMVDPIEAAKVPEPDPTPLLARLEERATHAARTMDKALRRAEIASERLAKYDAALRDVQARIDDVKSRTEELVGAKAERQRMRDRAKSNVKELKQYKTKLAGGKSIKEIAEDIQRSLMHSNVIPSDLAKQAGADTEITLGRLKDRSLNFSPSMRRAMETKGFLRTDLFDILANEFNQLSAEVGLREALDIRPGGRYSSWSDVYNHVHDDYQRMIDSATSPKASEKLIKEREAAFKDMGLLRMRLFGLHDTGLPNDHILSWLSRNIRKVNHVRYGDGFGIASMGDFAQMTLNNNITSTIAKHMPEIVDILKSVDTKHLNWFINSQEIGINKVNHLMARYDSPDAHMATGVGTGWMRKATYGIEQALTKAGGVTSMISGLPFHNRLWKTVSAVYKSHEMYDKLGKWASLSDKDRAMFANIGIGEHEAATLDKMFQTHGVTVDGKFDPQIDKWFSTSQGADAAKTFYVALKRHMDMSILTPGIGDAPAAFDHWLGSMYFQFMRFSMAQWDRLFQMTGQRLRYYSDFKAVAAMGTLMWSTAVIMAAADIKRGKDPMERYKSENMMKTTVEFADRSGLWGIFNGGVGVLSTVTGVGTPSRFEREDPLKRAMGGMLYSLPGDVSTALGSATNPDATSDKVMKDAARLLPWQTYTRFLQRTWENAK